MSNASGKLVIIGILTIALASAGISWWFRYSATHRAAQFWGPEASQLIRDAPRVEFLLFRRHDGDTRADVIHERLTIADADYDVFGSRDVSQARGLTHLRNALLENRSYDWPEIPKPPHDRWSAALRFQGNLKKPLIVLFPVEHQLGKWMPGDQIVHTVSCGPIAKGLDEMFLEFSAGSMMPIK